MIERSQLFRVSLLLALILVAGEVAWTQEAIAVRGEVHLPDGRPASGLEVLLLPLLGDRSSARLALEGVLQVEPAASAWTGPNGSFTLEAPEGGMWLLYVAVRDHRPMEYALIPLLESRRVPPLLLTREVPVAVRVLGSDGEPVDAALVAASAPPGTRSGFGRDSSWHPASRSALTNAVGLAHLGRGAGEALQVRAYKPGYLEAGRSGVNTRSTTLRLEPSDLFEARVVDPRGRPVADALVRISERRWPLGRTDETGSILVPLAKAAERLEILGPQGGWSESWFDPATAHPDRPRRITLQPAVAIEGQVLDAETGAALAGALAWPGGNPEAFVRTDATGKYSLAMRSRGGAWVWGAQLGYLKEVVQSVSGAAGGPSVGLYRSVRAHGVVFDERGRPVEGATIRARFDLANKGSRGAFGARSQLDQDVSTPEGRFSIGSLHPRGTYYLLVEGRGFAPVEVFLTDPRTDTRRELHIELLDGRSATGRLTGPNREPLVGAAVWVRKAPSSGDAKTMELAAWTRAGDVVEASTDAMGQFVAHDLGPGHYTLEASASGYATTRGFSFEIPATAVETDLGEIVLDLGAPIEGRVTDATGSPLQGARIFVESARLFASSDTGDTAPAAYSDRVGAFKITDRSRGDRVDLRIEMEGFATGSAVGVVAPTNSPAHVELIRASRIRGRVVDDAGRSVGGAEVRLRVRTVLGARSTSRSGGRATTDETGAFLVDGVEPGDLSVTTRASGYSLHQMRSLTIAPGEDLEGIEIVLSPGATVSGRVTDPAGRGVAFAQLRVTDSHNTFATSPHFFASADGEGRYEIEGLAPGRRTIVAMHDDYERVSREIDVDLGENHLDFSFEAGAEISGRVLDATGSPVHGAHVHLEGEIATRESVTASSGVFSFSGLPSGTYSLRAEASEFAPGVREGIELGPGGLSGVDVHLEVGLAIVGRLSGLDGSEYADTEVFATSFTGDWSVGLVSRDGTYRIDGLAAGRHSVFARVAGRGLEASESVELLEGFHETELNLQFDKGGLTLSGVVLKGTEPVPGVRVAASGIEVASNARANADHAGRFVLEGLESGLHTLSVRGFRSGLAHQEEIDLSSSTDIVVRVAAAEVSGHVLDASTLEPLHGAAVRLEPFDSGPSAHPVRSGTGTTTDSAGFFRFADASVGTYRLMVQRDGYAAEVLVVNIQEDADQDALEVVLVPTEGLHLEVGLPSGRKAGEFSAVVLDPSGRTLLSGIFSTGQSEIRLGVPPGTWELLVSASGAAVVSQEIILPGEPIFIPLTEEARFELRVPALETQPTNATVKLVEPSGRPFRGMEWTRVQSEWPLAHGRVVVPGLASGTWTVVVTDTSGRRWQGQVTLGPGENPQMVLD